MPVYLNNHLKFAKKGDRDKYIEILNQFNIESQQGNDAAVVDSLKNQLNNNIKEINPSLSEQDHLFNNMQQTALLAYETAFFKIITEKDNPEKYIDIYNKLYGIGSEFQKQLKSFENRVKKSYSIDKSTIDSNPLQDQFYAKLKFQKKVSSLLSQAENNKQNNAIITLPQADKETSISFLANIDPQLMAYIIVNNPITVKLEKHKKIDILHEGVIGMKALCCTFFDTSLLLAPAAVLGASVFIFGGLSLPLTVGVALICLSGELSFYEKINMEKSFDLSQSNFVKNQIRKNIDTNLNHEKVDLMPKQLWSPMQLFNVEYILKSIIEYIGSSYNKHKKEFQEKIPEVVDSLQELIEYNYLEHKREGKQKSATKSEVIIFDKHSRELLGVEIEKNLCV